MLLLSVIMFPLYEHEYGREYSRHPRPKMNSSEEQPLQSTTRGFNSVGKVRIRKKSTLDSSRVPQDPLVYSMIRHERTINAKRLISLPQLDKHKKRRMECIVESLIAFDKSPVSRPKQFQQFSSEDYRVTNFHPQASRRDSYKPRWF